MTVCAMCGRPLAESWEQWVVSVDPNVYFCTLDCLEQWAARQAAQRQDEP